MAEEWLPTSGTATKNGTRYVVTAPGGDGSFEIDESDIKVQDGKALIRNGTTARNTVYPKKNRYV